MSDKNASGSYQRYQSPPEDWMSAIPVGWQTKRARFCFKEVNDRSETGDQELLALSKQHGLVPRSELTDDIHRANSLEGYKICKEGDIVMNKMQAWNGVFGIADQTGLVSPDYTVFRPKSGVDPEYYLHLLKTPMYVGQCKIRSRGIGTAYLRLHTQHFYDIPLYFPPIEVQTKIATFINNYSDMVNTLIEKKEKLIQLLEEKKQALITQAVKEGSNSVSEMVSIHGQDRKVPEGWDLPRIGYIVEYTGTGTTPDTNVDEYYGGEIPWVQSGDLNDGLINDTEKYVTNRAMKECTALKTYPEGSVIMAMYGASIGNLGILQFEATTNQACCVLSPSSQVSGDFLFYSLLAHRDDIKSLSSGGTQSNINQNIVRDFRIPLPSKERQEKITRNLQRDLNRIDELVTKTEESITLLKEKREALITEIVTGQMRITDFGSPKEKEMVV